MDEIHPSLCGSILDECIGTTDEILVHKLNSKTSTNISKIQSYQWAQKYLTDCHDNIFFFFSHVHKHANKNALSLCMNKSSRMVHVSKLAKERALEPTGIIYSVQFLPSSSKQRVANNKLGITTKQLMIKHLPHFNEVALSHVHIYASQ